MKTVERLERLPQEDLRRLAEDHVYSRCQYTKEWAEALIAVAVDTGFSARSIDDLVWERVGVAPKLAGTWAEQQADVRKRRARRLEILAEIAAEIAADTAPGGPP